MRKTELVILTTTAFILTAVLGLNIPQVPSADFFHNAFADTSDISQQLSEADQQESLLQRSTVWVTRVLNKLGVTNEALKLYAKWIIGAPTLVLFILILMLLRPRRKITSPKPEISTSTQATFPFDMSQSTSISIKKSSHTKSTETKQVIDFFMRLYKHQQGYGPEVESNYRLIERRNHCPNDTYEMRVRDKEEWVTRRMSIGLLGQGGGSRSRCFYVIYDSHLVIKIPSEPILDFWEYNRQIAAEGRIVERLAPRQCIVPRVGVILKAIYSFEEKSPNEDILEQRYIHLLKSNTEYQEYLKLGESFAFFMDLAKYFFLSTTLEEIHHGKTRLVDEVLAYPELLWDHNGFANRYGEEAAVICHDLQKAYRQCEIQLRGLFEEAGLIDEVPPYVLRQWYLSHLVGEKISTDTEKIEADIIEKADIIIEQLLSEYQKQVAAYCNAIETYVHSVRFSQHHRHVENLATNTLDLLAWITAKGLALRDLKPENLFVAGNPKDYPIFLNDPSLFTIGLIDVETAVVLANDDSDYIPQPQLAGTPLYATPTHLLSNTILYEIFGDVRTTLQLQDWHATIAILFRTITGGNLFSGTAHVFPDIVREVKTMDPAGPDLENQVVKISRLFWNSALAEFRDAMHDHKSVISQIKVGVPDLLAPQIRIILAQDLKHTEKTMAALIAEQTFFTSEEKIRFLKTASARKIGSMKNRLIQERDSSGKLVGQRNEVLFFFKQLESLKRNAVRKETALSSLQDYIASIPADQLLEAMFQRVFQHMYPSHWPALTPAKFIGVPDIDTDITTYQATL